MGFEVGHITWNKGRTTSSPEERFWAKVNKNGPVPQCRPELGSCWIWVASKKDGYGSFWVHDGRKSPAHRFSYETLIGEIPVGLELDHLCRNRACVNPAHLRVVTPRINSIENSQSPPAINAKKTACSKGHEYAPETMSVTPEGYRRCLVCRRDQEKARWNARRSSHA